MSDFIKKTIAWKLAIFKGMNGWFTVVAMAFIAGADEALGNRPWMPAAKFILVILVAGNKFVDGFLDQTVQNLRRSQDPLGLTTEDASQPPTAAPVVAAQPSKP